MAERSDWAGGVIPLSRWLADARDAEALPHCEEHCDGLTSAGDEPSPVFTSNDIEEAFLRGRAEANDDAERRIAAAISTERSEWETRVENLTAELSGRCGQALLSSVEEAFALLRSSLECSLSDALLPFLSERILEKSKFDLVQLLTREIGEGSSPILEVRAPADLHDMLADLLRARGYSVTLSAAEAIEVISTTGTSRFATLAQEWIATIRGSDA